MDARSQGRTARIIEFPGNSGQTFSREMKEYRPLPMQIGLIEMSLGNCLNGETSSWEDECSGRTRKPPQSQPQMLRA